MTKMGQERDRVAYAAAAQEDTPSAYQVYLAACVPNGCGHAVEARERKAQAEAQTKAQAEAQAKAETEQKAKATGAAKAEAEPQAPGSTIQDCDVCPELVVIPAGSFEMGSPDTEPERDSNEGPRHRVRVPAFALGRTEVTSAQYDAFAQATGTKKPEDKGWGRGQRPVINVSWDEAQAFVNLLSQETGKAYRLPSEAEWEYAARAGTTTPFYTGNCIKTTHANYNDTYDYANCGAKTGTKLGKTQPVANYPPNPWGLYDLAGNVWEWVEDCGNGSYAGAPTDGSAWRHGDCQWRVLRGGSWNRDPRSLRSANRYWSDSGYRFSFLGFRVARTITPAGAHHRRSGAKGQGIPRN